jgi:hypothetical protein
VSKRILSCPPISCMPFNCPGHELFRKGLSGCGIDTVNAPVGTVFVLAFTVSDYSFPPATSEVLRRIIVVSPCDQGQTYCPDLAKPVRPIGQFACGTTDCISRAAILALQPIQPPVVPPSMEFSKALPVATISNRSDGFSLFPTSVPGRSATISSQVCCLVNNYLCSLCKALLCRICFLQTGSMQDAHQKFRRAIARFILCQGVSSASSWSIH